MSTNKIKTPKVILTRRQMLKYTLSSLAGSLWISGCENKSGDKPNILIVSIDTLRADHVSCYGYSKMTTPNIDRLANQSHCFRNAYTTMPTTLPAHVSLLTSLYPKQLSSQRNGEGISYNATTMAEIFINKNYNTAAFVSSAVMDSRYGIAQGFQTYDDNINQYGIRYSEYTIESATNWLKNNFKKRFFLFIHLFDPHAPYFAPKHFRKKFDALDNPEPKDCAFLKESTHYNPHDIQSIIAAYDSEIAYADWAVGELLQQLSLLGLDDKTLIVLLSDHGESLDELIPRFNYAFDHGEFLYTHQLHIPMLIRMPRSLDTQLQVSHTNQVSIIDVMPTILDIVNIKAGKNMAGISLLPILRGEKAEHRIIFSERRTFKKPQKPYLGGSDYSVIDGKWHLIFSTKREPELYHLPEDYKETNNRKNERQKIKELTSSLRHWVENTKPLFGKSAFETDWKVLNTLRSLGYTE